jgi:hypothetical protein
LPFDQRGEAFEFVVAFSLGNNLDGAEVGVVLGKGLHRQGETFSAPGRYELVHEQHGRTFLSALLLDHVEAARGITPVTPRVPPVREDFPFLSLFTSKSQA